jgi:hypothetical protein
MRDVSPREQWTECEASRKEIVEGETRPGTMGDSRLHYSALFDAQNEQVQPRRTVVVNFPIPDAVEFPLFPEMYVCDSKESLSHVRCVVLETETDSFWDMTPCNLGDITCDSQERTSFVFRADATNQRWKNMEQR